jgi:hypothetical protein
MVGSDNSSAISARSSLAAALSPSSAASFSSFAAGVSSRVNPAARSSVSAGAKIPH